MRIIIPGNPIPKARPKFSARGKHAMAYDPQKQLCDEKKLELHGFLSQNGSISDFMDCHGYISKKQFQVLRKVYQKSNVKSFLDDLYGYQEEGY